MNRQKIGYCLTLLSLFTLLYFYGVALFLYHQSVGRTFLGASITIIPLLYLTPGAILKNTRSYVALAVISPIHLFFGGVIFLWGTFWQGLLICFAAIILQIGTILHSYSTRQTKMPL